MRSYPSHIAMTMVLWTCLCLSLLLYCLCSLLPQNSGRKQQRAGGSSSGGGSRPLPDLTDSQAIQAYFLQEIQAGEEKLALGKCGWNLQVGILISLLNVTTGCVVVCLVKRRCRYMYLASNISSFLNLITH